jgi:Tol biopolymer transport system component/DNA-binding winged helix-turn-helix (wHTH) protein
MTFDERPGYRLTIGAWQVWPDRLEMHGPGASRRLEPLTMRLLLLLAEKAPETVTRDQIIDRLWDGRVVTDDAVNKQLSKLRAAIDGGSSDAPYLRTVPRVGVRLIRPVAFEPIEGSLQVRRKGKLWPATLALVFLSFGLVLWLVQRPAEWDIVQEPVTAVPGSEVDPALSPDGKMLAYVARLDPNQPYALYVRAIGSDRTRRLTFPDIEARVPAWSNDGRIAFVSRSRNGCRLSVGLPTGNFRDVAPCVLAEVGGLAWIDNNRLIISDHPKNGTSFRLSTIEVATGRSQLLVDPPTGDVGDTKPVVGSDRRTVYFLRNKSVGPSEIYSARIGDRRATALSTDGAAINGLSNGPSDTLLVSSRRGGKGFALWSLDPRKAAWRRLLPEGAGGITSTPDGSLAVYSRLDRQVSLWLQPFDGAEGRAIASSTRVDWSPALSPNGRQLAFLSNRTGKPEIWIVGLADGLLRRLTNFGGAEVQDLHWSRDGRMIATAVASNGLFDVHLIDVDSGTSKRIAVTAQDERQPFFAPDGRSLWFVRRDRSWFVLRSIDLVTKREVPLLDGAIRALPSSDGRSAYLAKPFEDGLWRADIASKRVTKLAAWPDTGRNRNVDVTADGIWSTAEDPSGGFALMRIDPVTGTARRVVRLPDLARPSGIAVSDKSVIYARLRREEADLVTLRFERRR